MKLKLLLIYFKFNSETDPLRIFIYCFYIISLLVEYKFSLPCFYIYVKLLKIINFCS